MTNTGLFKKGQVLKDSDINKDYFTPVSYTHLDVYKRQAPFRLDIAHWNGPGISLLVDGSDDYGFAPSQNFCCFLD